MKKVLLTTLLASTLVLSACNRQETAPVAPEGEVVDSVVVVVPNDDKDVVEAPEASQPPLVNEVLPVPEESVIVVPEDAVKITAE